MNCIDSTVSYSEVGSLLIYPYSFFLFLDPIRQFRLLLFDNPDCLFSDILILFVSFRITWFNYFFPNDLIQLFLSGRLDPVISFRTTILHIRFGLRYRSCHTSTSRLTSTGIPWRRDSPLLYLIPCLSVPENISCP